MNILKNIPFNVGLSLYMTDMDMMNTIQMRVLNRGMGATCEADFGGLHVARSFFLCVMFCRSACVRFSLSPIC
jgi:hypothetical protein